MVTSYLVVGASRGVGLNLVRQLRQRGDPSQQSYISLKNVHVVEGDITKYATLESCAKKVAEITGGGLDVLIHNAARTSIDNLYQGFDDFESMDELAADFIDAYKVNALGLVFSVTAFLPLLRAAPTKKIAVIGSEGGSPVFVKDSRSTLMCAYGLSKAAQHVAAVKWHLKLAPEGFIVACARLLAIVKACEGSATPLLWHTPAEAAEKELRVIDSLTLEQSGEFILNPRAPRRPRDGIVEVSGGVAVMSTAPGGMMSHDHDEALVRAELHRPVARVPPCSRNFLRTFGPISSYPPRVLLMMMRHCFPRELHGNIAQSDASNFQGGLVDAARWTSHEASHKEWFSSTTCSATVQLYYITGRPHSVRTWFTWVVVSVLKLGRAIVISYSVNLIRNANFGSDQPMHTAESLYTQTGLRTESVLQVVDNAFIAYQFLLLMLDPRRHETRTYEQRPSAISLFADSSSFVGITYSLIANNYTTIVSVILCLPSPRSGHRPLLTGTDNTLAALHLPPTPPRRRDAAPAPGLDMNRSTPDITVTMPSPWAKDSTFSADGSIRDSATQVGDSQEDARWKAHWLEAIEKEYGQKLPSLASSAVFDNTGEPVCYAV
ncbi:uncharacterized protein BXZ73DRAFT_78656 [Epithele typhae]|uniref:uncharacterized protein n=1 Tax=Epithele typhae TaxID=378194 RepID=UPI0020080EBD|nr:uncharacterized protein BXZ73DRAFT_78656 [Epithele typhae]KAH9926549.1 hypothetical protein BXZ73DRAFT_78656 [Epithele typhae]